MRDRVEEVMKAKVKKDNNEKNTEDFIQSIYNGIGRKVGIVGIINCSHMILVLHELLSS